MEAAVFQDPTAFPSAAAFVRAERERAPLDVMRRNLVDRESTLKAALTETVRVNFPSLLDITQQVGVTEDRVRALCEELKTHRTVSSAVSDEVDSRLRQFKTAMSEHTTIQRQADDVRLVGRLVEALGNLEALVVADSDAADVELGETGTRLLRAGGECGRVLHMRQHALHLPVVVRAAERIDSARAALLAQAYACLREALERTVAGGSTGNGTTARVLRDLVACLADCDAAEEAASWLREGWLAERLLPRLETVAAEGASLTRMGTVLEDFASSPAFAPLADADAACPQPLMLLSSALWAEWARFVNERMGKNAPTRNHTSPDEASMRPDEASMRPDEASMSRGRLLASLDDNRFAIHFWQATLLARVFRTLSTQHTTPSTTASPASMPTSRP